MIPNIPLPPPTGRCHEASPYLSPLAFGTGWRSLDVETQRCLWGSGEDVSVPQTTSTGSLQHPPVMVLLQRTYAHAHI